MKGLGFFSLNTDIYLGENKFVVYKSGKFCLEPL